ncbi:molybdenum cofactor biosynthesis protein MoaE [Teredinibacter waterburyi]|jgi:molybdopterin synthase subunit MoaE|uniref:molybdenum cofactor biosynthesis protein MoaE n=1 Tax=Teredinibacter waterburyi TaxID=1500538 RepID=UPI00165F3461|nr:molybdenum cofactor biosynthesis protein MoaE [Teredinibacter waterburyi]
MIRIQQEDFDTGAEYNALRSANTSASAGAIVLFTGLVREFIATTNTAEGNPTANTFSLQHYPGMTETVLAELEVAARSRYKLQQVTIIHRVGSLQLGDQIVLVAVSAAHRAAAFDGAMYIMDILKTQAPFWKKEGDNWVDAKESDEQAASRWTTESE